MSVTKFTYTEGSSHEVVTDVRIETTSDTLTEVIEVFARFLLACGFGEKAVNEHIITEE